MPSLMLYVIIGGLKLGDPSMILTTFCAALSFLIASVSVVATSDVLYHHNSDANTAVFYGTWFYNVQNTQFESEELFHIKCSTFSPDSIDIDHGYCQLAQTSSGIAVVTSLIFFVMQFVQLEGQKSSEDVLLSNKIIHISSAALAFVFLLIQIIVAAEIKGSNPDYVYGSTFVVLTVFFALGASLLLVHDVMYLMGRGQKKMLLVPIVMPEW